MGQSLKSSKPQSGNSYKNIIVFIVYRTPSHNSTVELTSDLNISLQKSKHENTTIILTGDLNIDLLKYNSHNQTNS